MLGEYFHTVDAKGRMNFPAKLRECLGDKFIISKQIGAKCLCVYSIDEWEELSKKIKSKPISQTMEIRRFLFGGACEVEPDKQGRIQLPITLRDYAGLKTDVVVIGMSGTAEIWDKDELDAVTSGVSMEMLKEAAQNLEL